MKLQRLSRRTGFTLVEMLVVIAIIGMLIAFLVPSFSKSKEMAARTRCQGNLRELVMAISHYAKDNEVYPDREKWLRVDNSQGVRSGKIYKYVGETKLFYCPSDREVSKGPVENQQMASANQRLSSYAINGFFHERNANVQVDMSLAVMFMEMNTSQDSQSSSSIYFDSSTSPQMTDRHSGGGNLAFCDGHTEWITMEKFQKDLTKIMRETPTTANE